MIMSLQKRSAYIDVVRSFAIICVVSGHCIQYGSGGDFLSGDLYFDNNLFRLIYSFHMPLFMLISGYLFAYSIVGVSWKNLLYSRIRRLVVPVLAWSVLPWGISMYRLYRHGNQVSVGIALKEYTLTSLNELWFLWAVFWCSAIVILVKFFLRDSMFVYCIIWLVTFVTPDVLGTHLYKFMYPFFLCGYLFGKNQGKEKLWKFYSNYSFIIVCGLLFGVLLLFFNVDSYIYTTGYYVLNGRLMKQLSIDLFRIIIGMVGSIVVLAVLAKIYSLIDEKNMRVLSYIGQNTMGIYIISGYFFSYVLNKITYRLDTINYFILLVEVIAVILFSVCCTWIISKSKCLKQVLLGGR